MNLKELSFVERSEFGGIRVNREIFKEIFENVNNKKPLVHCITNYVTVNDCANALLACGASPIMADDEDEVEEITTLCSALDINIGTLNKRTVNAMFKAGKRANELKHPVILDPVGVGASSLRTSTALKLISKIDFSVIRGNMSEIRALANGFGTTQGVDADVKDIVTESNFSESIDFVKQLSSKLNSVIAATGEIDIVADSKKAYVIRNGVPMLQNITGSGCMLSAITAAYCAANPFNILEAAATSVAMMGISGEIAYKKTMENKGGNGLFCAYLIDEISKMNSLTLIGGLKIELR